MNELYREIETLPGVGEKRAEKYHKMGINTPYDLLLHFPRTYIDFSEPVRICDADAGLQAVVRGTVVSKLSPVFPRKGLSIYRVVVTDGETEMLLVFYNTPYTYQALKKDAEYYFYGKITGGTLRREMQSPVVQKADSVMPLQPVYPQTVGLTSAMMRTNMQAALKMLDAEPIETLPEPFRKEYRLMALTDALHQIHRPDNAAALEEARHRLAFEELL